MRVTLKTVSLSVIALLWACTPSQKSEPILFGKEACHYCKMVITDARFGAELVTTKGKVFKFDAIECMAHHLEAHPELQGTEAYVVDSFNPNNLVPFKSAHFFHDAKIRSPMGKGLFATPQKETLLQKAPSPEAIVTWQDVLTLIGQSSLQSRF